jgi:hypothetical protein
MVKMTMEVGADSAKKLTIVGVADVNRVIETAKLDEDAASKPVVVLDEAEKTAEDDIPALTNLHSGKVKAVKDTEEPDCAAQDATEDHHKTTDDDDGTPEMEKAEAEEHNETTPTEVAEIAVPNAQFPEDKAVNEDGVN